MRYFGFHELRSGDKNVRFREKGATLQSVMVGVELKKRPLPGKFDLSNTRLRTCGNA